MMRNYETVFILTPVLSEAQMKETVQQFTKLLEDNGANVIHYEDWGLRKLAYPIQKKTTGFYHMIEFEAEPNVIEKLELSYLRTEKVVRFLTFKMDKYAVEYRNKKRNINKEKTEEA